MILPKILLSHDGTVKIDGVAVPQFDSPAMRRLLAALFKSPGRPIPFADLETQLGTTRNNLRVSLSRLKSLLQIQEVNLTDWRGTFSFQGDEIFSITRSSSTLMLSSPFLLQASQVVDVPRTLKVKCAITLDHYFTGRTKELQQLHEALTHGGTAGVTQAISGLGGIGKSSLARAYAKAHAGDYDAIFFLNASSPTSLNASYEQIDAQFDPPTPPDAPAGTARQQVTAYLQSHPKTLLLVDNADFGTDYTPQDLKNALPPNFGGHTLITTRAVSALRELGVLKDHIITLHDMEEHDAITLLWEGVYGKGVALTDAPLEVLGAIARTLYYFPLALEQAAAYIAEREISYSEYLHDQRHGVVALLEEQKANIGAWTPDEQYRRAVSTTWMRNVETLKESGKEASVYLLALSAFLAPERIPLKEIADAAALTFDGFATLFGNREPAARRAGDYAALLKPLLNYSLVTKDAERGTYDIHRLLQEVIRHSMPEDVQANMIAGVVNLLNHAFPPPEFVNWSMCERLTPHTLAVIKHTRRHNLRTEGVALLLNETAYYLNERGRTADALPLYVEALAIGREVLPPKHPTIATSLNNLATLYEAQSRYDDALPLYVEALAIGREVLPPKHPTIAASLNNLATLYEAQSRYDDALPLYVEALAIGREVLPPKHPTIAASLNNLATLYEAQSRYDDALPLYVEALAIGREVLPPKHPTIATSLNNLATLYRARGRHKEALLLYAEAIAVLRVSLEETHPSIKVVTTNAITCVIEMVLRDKELTKEKWEAMSESERLNLVSGPVSAFWASENVYEERLS